MLTESDNVIFEFIRVGHSLKVIAIDEETGIEASIIGDPQVSQKELQTLARQKLNYVMHRRES